MFSASPVLGASNHCWKSGGQALFYRCPEQNSAMQRKQRGEGSPFFVLIKQSGEG
jgi:hypothetical protein